MLCLRNGLNFVILGQISYCNCKSSEKCTRKENGTYELYSSNSKLGTIFSQVLKFMKFMELFMVVHGLYELFLVHSYDYEPVVHDISLFKFTGSWQSSNSYSRVHGKV